MTPHDGESFEKDSLYDGENDTKTDILKDMDIYIDSQAIAWLVDK